MSKPINAEVKPKYKDESIDKLIKRFNQHRICIINPNDVIMIEP